MRDIVVTDQISKYFKWLDALWLPSWNRIATEQDGLNDDILDRLLRLFLIADSVRDFFALPVIIHVAWRSPKYNRMIGGAADSAHMASRLNEAAIDFHVSGHGGSLCDGMRKKILAANKLEQWNMRMENNGENAGWIHLDTRIPLPGHSRYFKT